MKFHWPGRRGRTYCQGCEVRHLARETILLFCSNGQVIGPLCQGCRDRLRDMITLAEQDGRSPMNSGTIGGRSGLLIRLPGH